MREAVGPEARIRVDANAAWELETAKATLAALEPFDDRARRAAGRRDSRNGRAGRGTSIPLAGDESVESRADAERAVALGACASPGSSSPRSAGREAAIEIAEVLPAYVSSALDGPVGIAAAAQVAQTLGETARRSGQVSPTASPPSASSRRRSPRSSASCATGCCTRPPGPGLGRRDRRGGARRAPALADVLRSYGRKSDIGPAMDPTNANTALASAFVEELARGGLRQAVISPGSRSTPLAVALWRQPEIEVTVIVDERSAGFFALGAAQASGEPVALLCTSGTAAANFHPAMCEADESGMPLVVLTRRPAARAARDRRRADDRPDQALRLLGALVLRSRHPRRPTTTACSTTARPPAGRSPRPAASRDRAPSTSTCPGASRWHRFPSRGRSPRPTRWRSKGRDGPAADGGDAASTSSPRRSCSRRSPGTSATRSPA